MTRQAFCGATIFDGTALREGQALLVAEGEVAGIVPAGRVPPGYRVTGLGGGILSPGFVDLQVNGGGGVLLNDRPDVPGIRAICAAHARLGATGILPTLITDCPEVTAAALAAGIVAVEAGVPGCLGLHLEGPHLDPRRHGAHDPALIRPMTEADLTALLAAAARLPVLMVTLAPAGATPAQVARLVAAGVVVSVGHSDATEGEARALFAAGARAVTHLFNAMSPLGHREPGLAGAALDGEVHAGLIADGLHVVPAVLRLALRGKRGGAGRLFLVSDAMAVAGTDLAGFDLGGRRVQRAGGRLVLEDGTLAGADLDLATAVRMMAGPGEAPVDAALAMATSVPAGLVGARRGRLTEGYPADLVHLDAGLRLAGVWRAGVAVPGGPD